MYYHIRGDLLISDISFADDIIIFYNGSNKHVKDIKKFISIFEKESNLGINISKSYFLAASLLLNNKINQITTL